MSGTETDRFSVTMRRTELQEIEDYRAATGVQRNELVRRATLAYMRMKTGKVKHKDIEKAFREVGSIDKEDTK